MSILNTNKFISFEDILDNIHVYKKMFLEDGILAFRDANLSHEDHIKVHSIFSGALGAYKEENWNGYTENHFSTYTNRWFSKDWKPDEIMLPWHIEHPTYNNPIVLGTWNMHNFKTEQENGKTYFVNSKLLYEKMPDHLKSFLHKCMIYDGEANPEAPPTHKIIENHWITGEPVIRTSFIFDFSKTDKVQKLHTVEEKEPSEQDQKTYLESIKWIHDQLYHNLDIRIVHKWQQGDLVIPDIFLMYHAVTGGFDPRDREFVGIWSRKNKESSVTV
jgi:alpha-ketoglutarate-dependent taurine dioxygenase